MVVTRDINNVSRVVDALKEVANSRLEIGIFGEDDSKILMIASVHEFGVRIRVTKAMRGFLGSQGLHLRKDTTHINIPERSFIRAGFDDNARDLQKQGEAILRKVVRLEISPQSYFDVLGGICVSAIQKYMTDLRNPPNTDFTVRRKGSSNPLIDTGRMRGAVTWKVRKS